jgi:GH24 family phage-related lysozyme (muramidase)
MASVKDPNGLYGTITKFEGFKSSPYWDVNGYAIGFGTHTNPVTGLAVQPGDYVTKEQASTLLLERCGGIS